MSNQPVGISDKFACKVLADYILRGINTPIGVSDYELTKALPKELQSSLPSIEEIEKALGSEDE